MCGIFGYVTFSKAADMDTAQVRETVKDLFHRGPDAQDSVVGDSYVLCHTRLSFLDLTTAANQPMWDSEGRNCIVYNGEIYNYRSLRKELKNLGCVFRTESDTEVLLYGLITKGEKFLTEVEGMFAFGLYDSVNGRLLLGRDRFGIKPLYAARTKTGYLFCSEMRPLRNWITVAPNAYSVSGYVAGVEVATQGPTLIKGVAHCPTGHVIEVNRAGDEDCRPFFDLSEFRSKGYAEKLRNQPAKSLVTELDSLLQQSVEDHMIADVPVGALCSGGVDSSLIMSLACKLRSDLAVFHADVVGRHSERDAAETLAKYLGLELNVVEINDSDFVRLIPDTLFHYESPFSYHPNSVPFLAVLKLVKRNGVKAVLTGEGADECFLGYADIPMQSVINRYRGFLEFVRNAVRKIPRFGEIIWREPFRIPSNVALLCGLENEVSQEEVRQRAAEYAHDSSRTLNLLEYHLQTLLHRNDCLGMAASIEARFPYLDHRVVNFAINLPDKYKIKFSHKAAQEFRHPFVFTKWLLRKVAERHVPATLANRRKRGFPTSFFERMKISESYFEGSWVADTFALDARKIRYLMSTSSMAFQNRLLLLDGWARIHILGHTTGHVRDDYEKHITIMPE